MIPSLAVDIDGMRIAYRRAGAGPVLVLLHGGLGDSRDWRPQIQDLSADFTVVAWDAPGCGQSSDPPETWMMPDYADCLAAFVRAVGLERPHLLGMSWGGGLAIQLFARHPALPRSLILASAYAGWAGSLPPEEVQQRLERGLREAAMPAEQFVQGYLDSLLTESASPEVIDEALAIMRDVRPAGMVPMLRAFAQCDLRDALPTIDVPVLLLYGALDVRAPRFVAEAMHRQIPRSRLVVMSGLGHVTSAEAPERFNAEVRTFLREVEVGVDAEPPRQRPLAAPSLQTAAADVFFSSSRLSASFDRGGNPAMERLPTIDIEGLRIAYEQAGAGPALVMLHGVLGDSRHWSHQIPDLSRDFTVIAWHAPGCGQSDDPPATWSMPDYARCLDRFIQALALERPHLIGLSWGTALALELYRQDPAVPRSLVLASGYAGWAGSLPPEEVERRVRQAEREAGLPPEAFVPGWMPGLLTASAPQALVEEVAAPMMEAHPAGMLTMLRAMGACDLWAMLPTVSVPTLLLWGERDVRSPVTVAEEMHRCIPGSRLVVLPRAGHLANLEAPEPFNAAVREFLSEVAV
jgi:pimeloyl-ACP methyl ester carboxylesterase